MNEKPEGLYARFAHDMATLLMAGGVVVLGSILVAMVTMIYFVAYVFPLIGLLFLAGAVAALSLGQVGTATGFVVFAFVLIGLGSFFYEEYFLGEWGDMVPITQIPSYLSDRLKSVREK